MINPWIQFIFSVALIVWGGNRLTKSAAVIADSAGISTAWAGVLLLPLATSLPELVTTLRAVAINAPDLAVGNIIGSCLYNLLLLAAIDLVQGRGALTAKVSPSHSMIASFSIITVSLAAVAMNGMFYFQAGWIGVESLAIAIIYLAGSRLLYNNEKRAVPEMPVSSVGTKNGSPAGTGRAVWQFAVSALLILLAGTLITDAADTISLQTGLGHTLVGTIFLAISTSLPETVTTISAVRLGYLDMAVANVFGANFMNLFILFIADVFYWKGPIMAIVSGVHLNSAIIVIILSSIIIAGLNCRSGRDSVRIGLDALLVIAGYLLAIYMIFAAGGN